MQNIKQLLKSRRGSLLLLAGALTLGLTIAACDSGTGTKEVDTNPCVDSAVPCTRLSTMVDTGTIIFQNCSGCHGMEGHGYSGATPPLANSDFFMNNRKLIMKIVLLGYDSAITVNGLQYQSTMPTWAETFSDFQIASVLTYIRTQLNDSTVVSCDNTQFDENGFAICVKTPRTVEARVSDFITKAEIAHMRDSLDAPAYQP
jgi:mono/diheme cytochrome c family protein